MMEYDNIQTDDAENVQPDQPSRPNSRTILTDYLGMANIADLGDTTLEYNTESGDETLDLARIGRLVIEEYGYDEASRADWKERNEEGLRLARQMKSGRTYAGEYVADVCYPIIAQAAIQYHSRAYPAIVKEGEVVKYKPIGADPAGQKAARGMRVAQYMNWELLENMSTWEQDMDTMLLLQSVVGIGFKKTYPDTYTRDRLVCSEIVDPEDMVVYYYAADFNKCERKTHVLYMTHNEYIEQVRAGLFSDVDLPRPAETTDAGLHTLLEQHRLLDLDGDGYAEPYVVTVHKESGKVLRIVCRFRADGVEYNQSGEVVRIEPVECFTAYPFMPSFDGGVYGMGFGILLGPLNESVNTTVNQLLDAGSRSNFQGGFISRSVRPWRGAESGAIQLRRGEWRVMQSAGDDLRKGIVQLPASAPSPVLFQLLNFITGAAEKLSAQSDLLAGVQQQHNVPATSTMALMEQGMKVLSGIYKRVYRSLRQEFRKIHRCIAQAIDDRQYQNVVDAPNATVADWAQRDYDIIPMSTSAEITEAQQFLKAQAMLGMVGQGLDDMEIRRYFMEALGIPDVQRFMPKQPPQPPLQFTVAMKELELKERELAIKEIEIRSKDAKNAAQVREIRSRMVKLHADAVKALAVAEEKEKGRQIDEYERKMSELLQDIFQREQKEEENERMLRQLQARMQAGAGQVRGQGGMQGPGQPQPNAAPAPGPQVR